MQFHGEENVHEFGDDVDLERAQGAWELELQVSLQVKFRGFLNPVVTCGGDVDDPTACLFKIRWNKKKK